LNLDIAIPYKNWDNSPYGIVGWPLTDGFKEFKYFDVNKKKIILRNIFNISFINKNV